MPREEGTQRRNKGSRPMTLKNTLAERGIYSYSFQAGFWLLFTLISAKQLELRPWLDPKVWSVWDDGQEWAVQLLTAVTGCCTFVFTCYSNDLKLNFEWINYFQAGFITKFIKLSLKIYIFLDNGNINQDGNLHKIKYFKPKFIPPISFIQWLLHRTAAKMDWSGMYMLNI